MTIARTVKAYLEKHGATYEVKAHPRTYSSKETAAASHLDDDHIAKAVILRDKRGVVMAIIPAGNWVKLHALQQELNRPLEFVPEEDLDPLFEDCQPGAIPALGPAYGIECVLDEAISSLARVYFEAGDHQNLLSVTGEDFLRLLAGARHGFFSHPDSQS